MSDRSVAKRVLDATGHRCPVPTLRLRRALEAVAVGERVRLIADDPMARIDVPLFVQEAGHVLIESDENGGRLTFVVERRASSAAAASEWG
ncbi:MAG TPA: sulfurtransferase TusA family protein [Caulobacteraceae bacterium]|nr:sulfurtransferase TusA family protein [Caulobacteraceae bacterium]